LTTQSCCRKIRFSNNLFLFKNIFLKFVHTATYQSIERLKVIVDE
jgi:hypothetical protein